MKTILITISLVLFSFNSFADEEKDCSWFPTMLYQCSENFKCGYRATPDGPLLERELIAQNYGCIHKEQLPDGSLLECEWGGEVERSHVRLFYMDLIDKGKLDPGQNYPIGNKHGSNPVKLGIDLGQCKITKDGQEMKYDEQSLNQIMLATVTDVTKQKVKTQEDLENEISTENATSGEIRELSKRIRTELEGKGVLESLDVKALKYTSSAMGQVFDTDFYVADVSINGQRGSKIIMAWGESGIDIVERLRETDSVVPRYIKSSFTLDSEEKAKLLFKALRHAYARQDFSDNPADGYTRTVIQEGAAWTIYDAHDDLSDSGYTVATDGQGKVISLTNYFVSPED